MLKTQTFNSLDGKFCLQALKQKSETRIEKLENCVLFLFTSLKNLSHGWNKQFLWSSTEAYLRTSWAIGAFIQVSVFIHPAYYRATWACWLMWAHRTKSYTTLPSCLRYCFWGALARWCVQRHLYDASSGCLLRPICLCIWQHNT